MNKLSNEPKMNIVRCP